MSAWLVFLIVAIIFFFVEIYTPTMFFLNFALASIICAFLGIFTENYNLLVPVFVILSIVFILFLRPLLNIHPQRTANKKFESQYIGQQATVITDVTAFSGRIQIYDENWEARVVDEDAPEIKKDSKVTIVRHDDLTMFVEKKGKK